MSANSPSRREKSGTTRSPRSARAISPPLASQTAAELLHRQSAAVVSPRPGSSATISRTRGIIRANSRGPDPGHQFHQRNPVLGICFEGLDNGADTAGLLGPGGTLACVTALRAVLPAPLRHAWTRPSLDYSHSVDAATSRTVHPIGRVTQVLIRMGFQPTALGSLDGSACNAASWDGFCSNARTPLPMSSTVVSWPAKMSQQPFASRPRCHARRASRRRLRRPVPWRLQSRSPRSTRSRSPACRTYQCARRRRPRWSRIRRALRLRGRRR